MIITLGGDAGRWLHCTQVDHYSFLPGLLNVFMSLLTATPWSDALHMLPMIPSLWWIFAYTHCLSGACGPSGKHFLVVIFAALQMNIGRGDAPNQSSVANAQFDSQVISRRQLCRVSCIIEFQQQDGFVRFTDTKSPSGLFL